VQPGNGAQPGNSARPGRRLRLIGLMIALALLLAAVLATLLLGRASAVNGSSIARHIPAASNYPARPAPELATRSGR
jgi:hypothetical protein